MHAKKLESYPIGKGVLPGEENCHFRKISPLALWTKDWREASTGRSVH